MEVQKRGDGGGSGPWAVNSIRLVVTPRCLFWQHHDRNGSSLCRCNNQGSEGVMHLSLSKPAAWKLWFLTYRLKSRDDSIFNCGSCLRPFQLTNAFDRKCSNNRGGFPQKKRSVRAEDEHQVCRHRMLLQRDSCPLGFSLRVHVGRSAARRARSTDGAYTITT